MKNKGMIITSLLYAILVLFILVLFSIVLTISIRKSIMDNISTRIENEVDYIPPVITGMNVLPVFSSPVQTFTSADYAAGLTATDNLDGDITSNIICVMPASTINCTVTDNAGNTSAIFTRTTVSVTALTYKYSGSYQTFTAAHSGTYTIELWGAQGGSNSLMLGGKGAYTKGNIYLSGGQVLYIYVGNTPSTSAGGYNGGGIAGTTYNARGGGGATDVRLVSGAANNLTSLISRIMVAGGGGGADGYSTGSAGGAAGGLTGYAGSANTTGSYTYAQGGTQTAGGDGGSGTATFSGGNGTFGIGGMAGHGSGGGGGGGYYGGGGGSWLGGLVGSGAGGSSFISGYTGCNAVNSNGTNTGITIHYSNLYFTSMTFLDGTSASVPTQDGGSTQTGNAYSGYAKITFVSN